MRKGGHYLWVLAPYLAQVDPGFSFGLAVPLLGTLATGLGAYTPVSSLFVSATLEVGLIMSHPKEEMALLWKEEK